MAPEVSSRAKLLTRDEDEADDDDAVDAVWVFEASADETGSDAVSIAEGPDEFSTGMPETRRNEERKRRD